MGLDGFDFDAGEFLEGEDDEETSVRAKLGQLQVKINDLHIRFEEDYFSADKPYSFGLIADQLNLTSSPPGQELWHFTNFIKSVFDTRSASSGNNADPSLSANIFKDIQVQNCRVYCNASSKIFIPT